MKIIPLLLSLCAAAALAQEVPKLLPFQARLTDPQGIPVTNGVRLVQFRLYNLPTGGTPVWAGEIHRTSVNGGLVNVILGTKTPLAGIDFNQQLYLEMTVDVNGDNSITPEDPPMLPRQIVLPSVFSKEAASARDSAKLNGADWTAILVGGTDPRDAASYINVAKLQPGSLGTAQMADNSITTSKLTAGSVVDTNLSPASVGLAALKQEIINQLVPPGTINAFAGPIQNIPAGWLYCDGSAVSRASYQNLFNAIGISWGVGNFNGDAFNLPDLRGEFLRGIDGGTGRDSDRDGRVAEFTGGNTGNNVGTYEWDLFRSHTHGIVSANGGNVLGVFVPGSQNPGFNDPGSYWGQLEILNLQVQAAGGGETRPQNASVIWIIKY
jgi:microcystin-dependent protein